MAGVRALIDASVAAGNTPRVPAKGKGLLLTVAGRRGLRLMDARGDLTQAGQVYYEAVGVDPPDRRFDYTQEPTRSGPRIQIRLRDGTPATVRTSVPYTHLTPPTKRKV